MQITLPPEVQEIIDREIEAGHYETPEEVVIDAFRHLEGATVPHVPEEWLIEARAQADRGEVRELTDQVWQEIRERARNDARRGKPIADEVKY